MWHAIFIALHAIAATVALLAGIVAVPAGRFFRLYLAALISMAVALAAAVVIALPTLSIATTIIYLALLALAGVMLVRAWLARRLVPTATGVTTARYIGHVGFTLVALTDGFVIVALLRSDFPIWLLIVGAVAIVVIGHFALRVAKFRLSTEDTKERRFGPDGNVVRRLVVAEVAEATDVLLDSHANYPAFVHVFPDSQIRRRALRPFFAATIRDTLRHGIVDAIDHDGHLVAIAAWLPPGTFPWSPMRKLRATPALIATMLAAPRSFAAFSRIGSNAERVHPRQPHWYLIILGVRHNDHRHGHGGLLLRQGLARADRDDIDCYLETSDRANVSYYQRFDFTVTDPALTFIPDGQPYTGMTRTSQSQASSQFGMSREDLDPASRPHGGYPWNGLRRRGVRNINGISGIHC